MSLHPAYPPEGSVHTVLAMVTSSFDANAHARCLRLVTSRGIQSAWLRNEILPFEVAPGQVWKFTGEILNLGQYGEQFEIREGMQALPAGVLLIPFLTYHVPGLSQARAQRMWETLGDGLVYSMENGKVSSLARALGGPAATQIAALAVRTWVERVAYDQLAQELYQYGFTERILRAVVGHYGQQSLEYVRNDPYRLLAFAELGAVDRAALERFGISVDDERRLMGIVDAAVYALHDSGTVIFSRTQLETIVHQLADLRRQQVIDAVNIAFLHGRVVAATEHHLMGDGFARIERAVIQFLTADSRSLPEPTATRNCKNTVDTYQIGALVSEAATTRLSVILVREELAAFKFVKYLTEICKSRDEQCHVLAGSDALCQRIHAATGIQPVALRRAMEDGLVGSGTVLRRAIAIVSSTIDFATMAQLLPQLRPTDRLFFVGQPLRYVGDSARLLPALLAIDQIFRRVLPPSAADFPAVDLASQGVPTPRVTKMVYNPRQSNDHGLFWICVANEAFERAVVGVSHQLRQHGSVIIMGRGGDECGHYSRLIKEAVVGTGTTAGLGMISVVTVDGLEPGDSDSSVIILRQPEALGAVWFQAALAVAASRAVVVSTVGIEYQAPATQDDNSALSGFVTRWREIAADQEQQGQNE